MSLCLAGRVEEHAEAIAGAASSAAEGNLYQHQARKREDAQLAQLFSNEFAETTMMMQANNCERLRVAKSCFRVERLQI